MLENDALLQRVHKNYWNKSKHSIPTVLTIIHSRSEACRTARGRGEETHVRQENN